MKYKFNEKGAHIARMQKRLLRAGYCLSLYGADSHLGDETWDALQLYASDRQLRWGPQVPEHVTADLMSGDDVTVTSIPLHLNLADDSALKGVRFVDVRPEAGIVHPKSRIINGHTVRRNPSAVTGITIHQMAVDMQPSRRLLREADGDWALAFARRSQKVACHVTVAPGVFCATNPLDWYMNHGNRLNRPTVGMEVSGLFSGLLDDPDTPPREDLMTTWKGEPMEITNELIDAGRAALRWIVVEGRAAGMPIKNIYAHRQSNGKKPGDPGEGLWRVLVTEYAVPVLGLRPVYDYTIGSGRPIPKEWDEENGVGTYR